MSAAWTRLGDAWAVKLTDAPWPAGTGTGLSVTVKANSGRKTTVVLGAHIRMFRIQRGRFVDIYEVAKTL